MLYGFQDICRDLLGRDGSSKALRVHEFWAVNKVSFDLQAGECLGLVGPNGAGKSTLLKILNGIIKPDQGKVRVRGRLCGLIDVSAGFHPQLTGRENIFVKAAILGMSKEEINSKFETIAEFADIGEFLDTSVKFYSSGMVVRLGMALALHTSPQILLVDEVFAVGDINFQARCFNRIGELRRNGVAFILVSHNIHHISSYSNRVIVLDHGTVHALGDPKPSLEKYLVLMREKDPPAQLLQRPMPNGSGRIRFKDIKISDNNGNHPACVDATQPLSIVIEFEADSDFFDVELDVVINDEQGIFIQGSNYLYNQPLSVRRGGGVMQVRFPMVAKNGGNLHLTLALWSKGRYELFDRRREIKFAVSGCALSLGKVWLPCSFEVHCHDGKVENPSST